MLRKPESIFGNSEGAIGSMAIFSTDWVMCLIGRKIWRSSSISKDANVAVLEIDASTPPMRTRFPAGISSAGMKYL
jgi:hypothetical protein